MYRLFCSGIHMSPFVTVCFKNVTQCAQTDYTPLKTRDSDTDKFFPGNP
jgi:hypothetical protein